MVQDKVTQLSIDFELRGGEVSTLQSAAAAIQTLSKQVSVLQTQITLKVNDSVIEPFSRDFIELRTAVLLEKS
jgi:hypothetical protein